MMQADRKISTHQKIKIKILNLERGFTSNRSSAERARVMPNHPRQHTNGVELMVTRNNGGAPLAVFIILQADSAAAAFPTVSIVHYLHVVAAGWSGGGD